MWLPDPVAVNFVGLELRWYSLLFATGLACVWALMRLAATMRQLSPATDIDRLMLWISVGTVFGGRIGDLIFYRLFETKILLKIFIITEGGMSFHGGLIGVAIAILIFAALNGNSSLKLGDLAAGAAPIGLFCGRIGNLINQELFGIPTNVHWGIVFPAVDNLARHPSQLYEAFFEGIVLFSILYPQLYVQKIVKRPGLILGQFLVYYAVIRISIEPLRADAIWFDTRHFGVTLGQLYCVPMLAIGLLLIWKARHVGNAKATRGSSPNLHGAS